MSRHGPRRGRGDARRRARAAAGPSRARAGRGRRSRWLCAAVACVAACAPASRAPLDTPAASPWTDDARVAREVGRLLGPDPLASRAAEPGLLALKGAEREALRRHAARIPLERDRRWLHVLDGHGLLPPLSTDEAVDLRLWQALRPEPGPAARGRAALTDLARDDPAPLLARLAPDAAGADVLALALGEAGARTAGPALLDLYVGAPSSARRRAVAAALDRLVSPSRGPDPDATGLDLVSEAARVAALLRTHLPDDPGRSRSP